MASGCYQGTVALPLTALFDVLPPDIAISLEAPHRDLAGFPVRERLRLAGARTLAFVAWQRVRRAP